MSTRFEYKHDDEPKDDQEEEEDAFPSAGILLVPVVGEWSCAV